MKIKSNLLLAINVMAVFIPTIVFAHSGHGDNSVSSFLHQIIYHANEIMLLLLLVIFVGLGLRMLKK